MTRTRRGCGVVLTALALTGCGGLLGRDSGGDPLVLLEGELGTTAQGVVVSGEALRATLVWQRYADETVQCAEEGRDDCAIDASNSPQFSVEMEDVAVRDGFPQVFRMPLYAPPPESALNARGEARLGLASVLAYQDLNGNGRLDPVGPEDTASTDHVVGYQGKQTEAELYLLDVVYREGPLHPVWRVLFEGCPEPGPGYSVVRQRLLRIPGSSSYRFESCTLETGTVKLEMFLPKDGVDAMACSSSHGHDIIRAERPPATAPDAATTTSRCVGSRQQYLAVNYHPERICASANTRYYTLYNPLYGDWDDRGAPPAWWPCAMSAP